MFPNDTVIGRNRDCKRGLSPRVQIVSSSDGLQTLQAAWARLWEQDAGATVFQRPEWLVPWWRNLAQGELLCVAVYGDKEDGGDLQCLVPCYVYTEPTDGTRKVFPLGIGTSDYLGFLCGPDHMEVLPVAVARLLRSAEWDSFEAPNLPLDSPLLKAEIREVPFKMHRTESEPTYCLGLPGCVNDLANCVPRSMLRNLRYYRRRIEQQGVVSVIEANESNVQTMFEDLVRLHRARWESRGEKGVLAEAGVCGAHREALPLLLRAGVLRMRSLCVNGNPIAVYYGLLDRKKKRSCFYLGGMDPRYASTSPGTILIGYAIEEAVREGATVFDFLRGAESYKLLWGATPEPTASLKSTGAFA